jgi:O-antigen/teichoic acid export membrane protein
MYGATRGLTDALLGARGLVLASLLGPTGFGGWTLFRLAGRYATFGELGLRRGLEFEVAKAQGGRQPFESLLYGRTAFGYTTIVFGTLAAVALAASLAVTDPLHAFGLRAFAVAVLLERLWFYGLAYLRACGGLRSFALLEVTNAVLHLGVTTVLAVRMGLRGALLGFVLAAACSVVLILRRAPFVPLWSRGRLREMLAVGTPLALTSLSVLVLQTVDRLVVAVLGGTTQLGYYGFGTAVATIAGSLAWVVRTVIFPEVYRNAQEAGAGSAVAELLKRAVAPYALIYPPLLGGFALFIGPAVATVVPRYLDAVPPARLFILTGATLGFSSIGSLGLVAASRQRWLPLFAVVGLGSNLGLSAAALHSDLGLEGVAAAALICRTMYGAAILGLNGATSGMQRPVRFALRSVAPLIYCAVVVFGLGVARPEAGWRSALVSLLIYAIMLLPLAPAIVREIRKLRW